MPFVTKRYLDELNGLNIGYSVGTGQYKGDYYVCAGNITPHIHVSKSGEFVGLKKKQGAITTLVKGYMYNREAIQTSIEDVKVSGTQNDQNVVTALKALGRMEKSERE